MPVADLVIRGRLTVDDAQPTAEALAVTSASSRSGTGPTWTPIGPGTQTLDPSRANGEAPDTPR